MSETTANKLMELFSIAHIQKEEIGRLRQECDRKASNILEHLSLQGGDDGTS